MVTIPTIVQISGTTVMNKMRSLINNYIEFGTEVADSISYMEEVIENLPHDITDVYNKATIDSMFATVNDKFDDYYVKSVVYTKSEVNDLISTIGSFHAVVVDELPEYGEEGIIYLLQIAESGTNIYKEYIWVNRWELIGQLSDIDLNDYYTKTESDGRYYTKTESDNKYTQGVGDIGSDTKPIKIVGGVATPVLDNLAIDSGVVHKSGNESISGNKEFGGRIQIKANFQSRNTRPTEFVFQEIQFLNRDTLPVAVFRFQEETNGARVMYLGIWDHSINDYKFMQIGAVDW